MRKIFIACLVSATVSAGGVWMFLQPLPETPNKTLDLSEFVNEKAYSKKQLVQIFNMGGTFTLRNGVATTTECSVNTGYEPNLENVVVSLPFDHDFDKWLLQKVDDTEKFNKIEKPKHLGTVTIKSNLLATLAGPKMIEYVSTQLVSSTRALINCYQELAKKEKNKPLI